MFDHVVHRFLDDAVKVDLKFGRQESIDQFDSGIDLDGMRFANAVEHDFDGFSEPKAVEFRRTERPRNSSHFVKRQARSFRDFGELPSVGRTAGL